MRMVVAIVVILLGMTQAIPCSVVMPSTYGNMDSCLDRCVEKSTYKQALASDYSSTKTSAPIPHPCASCSALCYHAGTLTYDELEPILQSDQVSDTLTVVFPPSSVHLDSLKRPPRLA